MQEDRFEKAFKKLCDSICPDRYKPAIFDAWCDALAEYNGNEIEAAIDTLCRTFTPVSYKPFPVPADLIQIITEQRESARRVIFHACDMPPGDPPPENWEQRIKQLEASCLAHMTPEYLKGSGDASQKQN